MTMRKKGGSESKLKPKFSASLTEPNPKLSELLMRDFNSGRKTDNLQDPQPIVRRGQSPFQMYYLGISRRYLGMQRSQVFVMCSLTVVADTSFYNNRSNKYGVMTNIDA